MSPVIRPDASRRRQSASRWNCGFPIGTAQVPHWLQVATNDLLEVLLADSRSDAPLDPKVCRLGRLKAGVTQTQLANVLGVQRLTVAGLRPDATSHPPLSDASDEARA